MYCIYIRKRTKGIYCAKRRTYIVFSECNNCLNKEYKKVSKNGLKPLKKTPIKKVSKKRVFVSKKTYNEVFERCNGVCAICGTNQNLHLHHIDGRGKYKTDDPNNCVILCSYCHLEVVHKNNKYWRTKLKEITK